MPSDDRRLLYWIDRLFGLPPDWVAPAVERLRKLGIDSVQRELITPQTADAAVGCYFLDEALEILGRYVPENKLIGKLRGDPDLWPTWAELRTAAFIIRDAPPGSSVDMDPLRSAGAHPGYPLSKDEQEHVDRIVEESARKREKQDS